MSILCDDVLHWAATYAGPKFHAMLTDAPYHLISNTSNGSMRQPGTGPSGRAHMSTKGFMGKDWDGGDIAFRPDTWKALAQHLLPGAFGMCFGSSRGWHRLACAIEDAGLIIHPSVFMLGWATGQGFPKATRIDTAVDKAAGAERKVVGAGPWATRRPTPYGNTGTSFYDDTYLWPAGNPITAPATDLAAVWEGHRYGGQVLKPSLEPVIVFQVPYQGRPVDSITGTGAGALWIEGARIGTSTSVTQHTVSSGEHQDRWEGNVAPDTCEYHGGRWPPNLALVHLPTCKPLESQWIHVNDREHVRRNTADAHNQTQSMGKSASDWQTRGHASPDSTEVVQAYECAPRCPVANFDSQAGALASGAGDKHRSGTGMFAMQADYPDLYVPSSGPASRFMFTADWSLDVAEQLATADPVFYSPKAARAERDEGLSGIPLQEGTRYQEMITQGPLPQQTPRRPSQQRNTHPTVKPIALCQWLATLLLPPGAYAPRRILIPFAGSGSECVGATLAGWEEIVGIEQDPATVAIANQRLVYSTTQIAAQLSLWP